jgi:hypothetical protein
MSRNEILQEFKNIIFLPELAKLMLNFVEFCLCTCHQTNEPKHGVICVNYCCSFVNKIFSVEIENDGLYTLEYHSNIKLHNSSQTSYIMFSWHSDDLQNFKTMMPSSVCCACGNSENSIPLMICSLFKLKKNEKISLMCNSFSFSETNRNVNYQLVS